MNWISIIAIYVLFWVICAFVILPIGIRSMEELGQEKIEGQQDGVPGNFNPGKVILRTTLLSALLFGIYYLNYVYGWIDRYTFQHLLPQQFG